MVDDIGGRVFFTNARRSLVDEDEIVLTSIGVDIGSSTSHLAYSRIVLERADTGYVVASRKVIFESDILLTPYAGQDMIDVGALDAFLKRQCRLSGIAFGQVDTGALILTGTALRRRNSRAIAELFAVAAGKFVAVSAGDEMETVLAAHGSGAVARSRVAGDVLNVDMGGGTTKIAWCRQGDVENLAAMDIGARLIVLDDARRIIRLESPALLVGAHCGITLSMGQTLSLEDCDRLTEAMADCLIQACEGHVTTPLGRALLRVAPSRSAEVPKNAVFSGGVAEFIYDREAGDYGDLGPLLARKIAQRITARGIVIVPAVEGIRATVIGASQYTIQLSGSTIYVSHPQILPLKNVPAIKPHFSLDDERPDAQQIAQAVRQSAARLGAGAADGPVAVFYRWTQSATFARIDAFCRGLVDGLDMADRARPIVLVGERDIGGLIGCHIALELGRPNPIVSVDGVSLQEFDHIDIGGLLEGSGCVPVVVKSLVFPTSGAELAHAEE